MCEGESHGGKMTVLTGRRWLARCLALGAIAMAPAGILASAPHPPVCRKIVIIGEVTAAHEWKVAIGDGWVFRVVPINASRTPLAQSPYTGWDLVVDREQPAGFPDALLLATPPYDSINEREVGTTFGVRAQDAIGWNPRSFRFLTDPAAFSESQRLFFLLHQNPSGPSSTSAVRRMMELAKQSAGGEFHILDAHLVPGIADATPFAQNWALASSHTPHTFQPDSQGKSTALGELRWMRFSVTLWLPHAWKASAALYPGAIACPQ